MEDYSIARQVAEWNQQGKKRGGRPVNTWKDWIRDSMQRRNPKGKNILTESSGGKEISLGRGKLRIHRKISLIIVIMSRIDPLLGSDSVNTSRDTEYATIEDIRCQAMDVSSAWSDPRLYNKKPTVTDSSVGGRVD
jgi:hypothetical protein